MRKNLIPLLAIALVIAGLCTVIFYGLIADRFGPTPGGAKAAPMALVVAAKSVERGKVLETADLTVTEGVCPAKTANACFTGNTPLLGRTTLDTVVEGQPFTEDLVAKRTAGGPSAVIPRGMRAVTLHAADSSGVVKMIRSGDRIDLQVIGSPDQDTRRLSVQRVWENIEVLSSQAPDPGSSHAGRPVITVLLPPADAQQLSLDDTVSRIRVVLRNRLESGRAEAVSAPAVPPVSKSAPVVPTATSAPAVSSVTSLVPNAPPSPTTPARPSFLVRLVSVNPEQLAGLGGVTGELQPRVQSVSRADVERTLARLEQEKTAHVLSSRPMAGSLSIGADGQSVGALGPGMAGVRLRVQALAGERWRVEPEAQTGQKGAASSRRAETEIALARNEAWLVSGLLEHKAGAPVLPGQGSDKEPRLVLVITPAAP